jgi:hypothetical protein
MVVGHLLQCGGNVFHRMKQVEHRILRLFNVLYVHDQSSALLQQSLNIYFLPIYVFFVDIT